MSLKFEIWDPDDVRAMAVCRVKEAKICMRERRHSVFDERMGPLAYLEQCTTCGSYIAECTGHFGYIELVAPMYHPLFVDYLWQVVKNACWNCRKPRPCACGAAHGTWKRKRRSAYTPTAIWHELRHNRVALTTADVHAVLKHAGRGELMLTAMPVAPPVVRPSRRRDGTWSHDPLTHAYAQVVRENAALRAFLMQGVAPHVVQAQVARLQEAIDKVYLPTTGERPTQGFRGRLDGKQGRFRQNLMASV